MKEIQIYEYQNDLDKRKKRIMGSKKIMPANKELVLKFLDDKSADRNISIGRIRKLACMLQYLSPLFDKDLRKFTMEDYKRIVSIINNQPEKYLVVRKTASEAYKCDLRTVFKMLIRYIEGDKFDEKKFKWFVTSIPRNKVKSRVQTGETLTVEEVEKMILMAGNTRDKAIIATAYESAARPSELLTLRVGSVIFDKYGAVINIRVSKTEPRPVRLIKSAPYLKAWLNIHPQKNEPSSPLWVMYKHTNPYNYKKNPNGSESFSKQVEPLSFDAYRKMLKLNALHSGVRKRVYAYIMRHSRITHLVQMKISETVIKKITGHVQDSESFDHYVHLTNKDVDEAFLRSQGLIIEDDGKKLNLTESVICFNKDCGTPNSPDAKFCENCNFPLDFNSIAKFGSMMNEIMPMMQTFMKMNNMSDSELAKIKKSMRVKQPVKR